MKKHTIALAIIAVSLILLGACGKSADELGADSGKQVSDSTSTQEVDLSAQDPSDPNAGLADDGNDSTKPSTESHAGEPKGESKKDAYLKKLNEMEEADRYAEDTTTTAELVDQETARYEKWDKELNEIYGQLREQLSKKRWIL